MSAPLRLVRVDGADRPYPKLHPCTACGRDPELATGYPGDDSSGGPFFVSCDHGETPEQERARKAAEEAADLDAWADWCVGLGPKPRRMVLDETTPGVLCIKVDAGRLMYRSWDFDRAVAGWNRSHPRMRALTILQPSASAIAAGVKDYENRPKPPPSTVAVGEWIALHAGVAPWKHADMIRQRWPECPPDADLPFGSIIGAWRYDGTVPPDGTPWALGPCCLRVGAVVRLPEPIPCRDGFHQGYWFLPGPIAAQLRRAIRAAS